jgi:hypothetical protein
LQTRPVQFWFLSKLFQVNFCASASRKVSAIVYVPRMQMSYETSTLASREIALPGIRAARDAPTLESSTHLQRVYPWICDRAELKPGETGEQLVWLLVAACGALAVAFTILL